MPLTLNQIPGFSDLSDSAIAAERYALGIHLNRISQNASFGTVRMEIFSGIYEHNEEVSLPVSPVDGYVYSRDELIYTWAVMNTADPETGWASYREPWTMWYLTANVSQTSGKVSCFVGYRGNMDHLDRQAQTNDGVLQVFTIAQRQKTGLIVATEPTFTEVATGDLPVDAPLREGALASMNAAAKLSAVSGECIYMGEFSDGATIAKPVSPVDGKVFEYSEVKWMTSWRWTAEGTDSPTIPAISKGQLQDWSCSIDTSGLVKIANTNVAYENSGTHNYADGKVAVFAFCSRTEGMTLGSVADNFAELPVETFYPGETLRASTMQQLNENIKQSVCTPEFFADEYGNGDTVDLPVSPIDGYTYSRDELMYVWDWVSTGPSASSSSRISFQKGGISTLGVVSIDKYRLTSGASNVTLVHEGTIRVITIARRGVTQIPTPPAVVFPPDLLGGGGDIVGDDVGRFLRPTDIFVLLIDDGSGAAAAPPEDPDPDVSLSTQVTLVSDDINLAEADGATRAQFLFVDYSTGKVGLRYWPNGPRYVYSGASPTVVPQTHQGFITYAGAAAITLDPPTEDGITILLMNVSGYAHEITISGASTGFNDGGTAKNTATLDAVKGSNIEIVSYLGKWWIKGDIASLS